LIPTDAIAPGLAAEFIAGVAWLKTHRRPDLTLGGALAEAVEDWIAALRTEHLRGEAIPRAPGELVALLRDSLTYHDPP
jgi:hypothetical protein